MLPSMAVPRVPGVPFSPFYERSVRLAGVTSAR